MSHQIEQLCEEVREKDEVLKKEALEHDRKKKDTEKAKEEVGKARQRQEQLQFAAEEENAEIRKLE